MNTPQETRPTQPEQDRAVAERRRLARRHLKFYSQVVFAETQLLLGYLENLTREGAMIVTDKPVRAGALFRLTVALPDEFAPDTHLTFEAESVWSRKNSGSEVYDNGLRLVNIQPDQARIIERIVTGYSIEEEEE